MPNTVERPSNERHSKWSSERRTERGSGAKDPRQNPNFNIDRSTPAAKHTYGTAHPKPTIIQTILGTRPGSADVGAVRRAYNKETFKPGMRELKRGFRRPATMLKHELSDLRRGEGFSDPLPHLAENPELRRRLSRKKESIYDEVRRLERRAEDTSDPRDRRELDRARHRADAEYENLVEDELRELKLDTQHAKRELMTDRETTMRTAREEIYGGKAADEGDEDSSGELA